MTIVIVFHQSRYRDFKIYYIHFICRYLTNELVSYTRIFRLMQGVLVPFCSYLTHRQPRSTGIAFVGFVQDISLSQPMHSQISVF
nr:hypothetical protein [Candidatus Enterovibrio escacola]